MSIGMERKMPWPISGWQSDRGWITRGKNAALFIKFPDSNLIQAKVCGEDKASRAIRLDHVRMRRIMPAEGETPCGRISRLPRSHRPAVFLHIRGVTNF